MEFLVSQHISIDLIVFVVISLKKKKKLLIVKSRGWLSMTLSYSNFTWRSQMQFFISLFLIEGDKKADP